jgi:hypothetical protein
MPGGQRPPQFLSISTAHIDKIHTDTKRKRSRACLNTHARVVDVDGRKLAKVAQIASDVFSHSAPWPRGAL